MFEIAFDLIILFRSNILHKGRCVSILVIKMQVNFINSYTNIIFVTYEYSLLQVQESNKHILSYICIMRCGKNKSNYIYTTN